MSPQSLKIKCRPEDFVVDEISELPLSPRGEYAVYRLRKRGWNTVDALSALARELGLSYAQFAYGGKKDRYGQTSQLITIRDPRPRPVQAKNYSLEFIGLTHEPMGPHAISANRFEITVRKLSPEQVAAAGGELARVAESGYPNYFDDQRFGGYDAAQGFLGEKILKRHWNGAVKAYLASIHPQDKPPEKARKRQFLEHWSDWEACARVAAAPFERAAFAHLRQHPGHFLPLVERIPREDLGLAISAYQSFLWNEWLRRWLDTDRTPLTLTYPGAAGPYLFFTRLSEPERSALAKMSFPTLAARMPIADARAAAVWAQWLAEQEVHPALLLRAKLRQAAFKSTPRPVLVRPQGLSQTNGPDELYPGHHALVLRFTLPRGSYATLLVKRLFAEER